MFTDGRDVFYGREGDIIEGRYRIVKIDVESVDIAYLDGRGQKRMPPDRRSQERRSPWRIGGLA